MLLIFLLEILLLLLLNLIRLKNYSKNVGSFLKSVLVFAISQALATIIYCYGISLIYVQNPSLSFSTITTDIQIFTTFYFETHQFILSGFIYVLFALLIKMGLGPLGLWILFSVTEFTYPFLALYFSFIKPLYFIIITKLIGNTFASLYALQGFIQNSSSLYLKDPRLLEYFKFSLLNQSYKSNVNKELLAQVSDNISLNLILENTQILRDNINTWVLAFSLFSIIIGAFGLIKVNDFKKFIAYSSMLNYGFVFYPVISGYLSSVHYSIIYILSYSLINLIFIWVFNILFTNNINNISNLSSAHSNQTLLSLFLISLLISMAGLPPFLGFFTKTAVLFELIKIFGPLIGSIFIFFTLIGAFGYARVIKNIYGINSFNNFFTNLYLTPIYIQHFFVLNIFIFILVFILNTFIGYFLVYVLEANTLTIFNSFVFNSHPFLKGTFIEHNLLQILSKDFGISLFEFQEFLKKFIEPDNNTFVENIINHQADLYSQKKQILTGNTPTSEEILEFKNTLRKSIAERLSIYTPGDGLEYTKLNQECLAKFKK